VRHEEIQETVSALFEKDAFTEDITLGIELHLRIVVEAVVEHIAYYVYIVSIILHIGRQDKMYLHIIGVVVGVVIVFAVDDISSVGIAVVGRQIRPIARSCGQGIYVVAVGFYIYFVDIAAITVLIGKVDKPILVASLEDKLADIAIGLPRGTYKGRA